MPLHITNVSRRQFIVSGGVAATSALVANHTPAGEPDKQGSERVIDPDRLALLSDTHIPGRPDVMARGVNMTNNLRQVVGELLALKTCPSGVVINGDCAYLQGLPADYQNLADCIAPLSDAGVPLHLTMGNHDNRGPLYDALANQRPEMPLVESKHVSIVQLPHANFFLLDSLFQVDVVTGELGKPQLKWLVKRLDESSDKPAIIVAHHDPQFMPPDVGQAWGGLRDTAPLFEILKSMKHVKAYIYGHTHNWSIGQHEGIHLINLPPVAYVFASDQPNGWVNLRALPDGLELQLNTIDPADHRNGEKITCAW